MAVFKSRAYLGGVPFRPVSEEPFSITASVLIPNGTSLASGDLMKFFTLGADVRILDVTLTTDDLDSDGSPAVTLDLGYDLASGTDDDDAFLANSTLGQAGGIVRVENGGDDAFAVGGLAAQTVNMTIQAKVETAPATNPSTDRYLTCTVRAQKRTNVVTDTPYIYADRYTSAGVSST